MKEKMLEQFNFSEELKEKVINLVIYKKQTAKDVARMYDLPNIHIITNWVRIYKKNFAICKSSTFIYNFNSVICGGYYSILPPETKP